VLPDAPPCYPSFLVPSTSKYELFERYSVYDPSDPPPATSSPVTMFMGEGRFGFPPFTAEIDADVSGLDALDRFRSSDIFVSGDVFVMPGDNSDVDYVCLAIESARRLIDLTLLNTAPQPIFAAGKLFIAGTDHYLVGQAQVAV
jgi:hypothetical protein